MAGNIYSLAIMPGIQRDGTTFSSRNWIDGQWSRFYQGLPLKMGGYSQLAGGLSNVPRGTYLDPNSPNFNVYIGDSSTLKYFPIDESGTTLGPLIDRTPVLFAGDQYNLWSFDTMYSDINNSSVLLAHAAPNLFSIDNNVEAPIYYGNSLSNAPLVSTGQSVSGGIVSLHPYLFMFGNNGEVRWSNANDPTTIMDSARICARKIVAGLATRGGNSSPAGLLWSLDSLIRVTQVGSNSVEFRFDTVTGDSSVLSSKGIVEYDGTYFWAGVDRFLYYNGVVNELPNDKNLLYFFQNLNYSHRQKVWATKITQWGEIWWFYPSGINTECDRAVIHNVREKTWYDVSIQRGSGYFEQTFAKPIWTSNVADGAGQFSVWQHEVGTDQNVNGALTAINSYVQSGPIAWCAIDPTGQQQHVDRWVDLYRLEPDFIQTGDMSLIVNTKQYARSNVVSSSPYIFTPTDVKIDLREQGREMSLLFTSNAVGGYYQMGQVLMVMRTGDARQ